MMSMNLSDIAIWSNKGSDYRGIISLISKNEAISLMQNADCKNRNIIKHKDLLWHIKVDRESLNFDNIEIEKNKL